MPLFNGSDTMASNEEKMPLQLRLLFAFVWIFIAFAIWVLIDMVRKEASEEKVVRQNLVLLLSAIHQSPLDARVTLNPHWKELQSVSDLTLAPAQGGTRLRWDRVGTDGCEVMQQFFAQHPEQGEQVQIVQSGVALDPGSYGDMSCYGAGHHIASYTFEFRPR